MTDRSLMITPLDSHHDRNTFVCHELSLDNYIKKQAKRDVKRRVSRVFVASEADSPSTIIGYYTLSSLSILLDELPQEMAKKLPRHPIPAALLRRLAVDHQYQGQGIGRLLLADAIKRALSASRDIAIYAMVVDALNEPAKRFYQQYGFTTLSGQERRLFLPLQSISSRAAPRHPVLE